MAIAELKGEIGERLAFSFFRKESWGDVRLFGIFKSAWVELKIEVLTEKFRLKDFSEKLQLLSAHNSESATFINADGNCEIACTSLPNGKVEVVAHLMPDMTSDSLLHTSFQTLSGDCYMFGLQIMRLIAEAED